MQKLSDLGEPEEQVRREQHHLEQDMAGKVPHLLPGGQVGAFDEGAARPRACDFDPVDGGAQELVVGLDDAEVAADEDQGVRPLGLVAEDLADGAAGGLLHFVVAAGVVVLGEVLEVLGCGEVAAAVGAHEGGGGEDVGVGDAPLVDDFVEGRVVECEERFPEAGVLVAEGRVHVDVEAVVDEDELRAPGGLAAHEDVAWVGVAVHDAPEEHLGGEEVDHGCHDVFEGHAQAAAVGGPAPGVTVGFELVVIELGAGGVARGGGFSIVEGRAAAAWAAAVPAAAPGPREGVLVPEADALDPLGGHDALGAELAIDIRDVDAAAEAGLAGDEAGHGLGVVGLVLKVGLEREALADIGDEAVEGNVEDAAVDPGDDLEGPEVPLQLLGDLALLDLDSDLAAVGQARPVHLGDTGAGAGAPLHDAFI